MTQKGFSFDSAPSGTGGFRGVTRQVVAALSLGGKSRGDGNNLSLEDRKALIEHQAHANVYQAAAKHVIGQEAAKKERSHAARQAKATRAHQASESAAAREHEINKSNIMAGHITSLAENPSIRSANVSTGSFTRQPTRQIKNTGVGGEAPAVNLENL